MDVGKLHCRANRNFWVDWKGVECPPPGRIIAAEECADLKMWDLSQLPFRNPDHFSAGELHHHVNEWAAILGDTDLDKMVLGWIKDGVHISSFFEHFDGTFKGKKYCCKMPPRAYFQNSHTCEEFAAFVTGTIYERVQNGSMMVWGRVGDADPPRLVMPLTIEETKPRLCHNEMYLNLFCKDCPMSLDTLKYVPGLVRRGMFYSSCDDKSGYDHVKVTEESRTFLGVQWGGYYFVYTVLPFGFKASAYIYQTIGMAATSYLRSMSVQVLQYIDDRFIGENNSTSLSGCNSYDKAQCALYQVCQVLTRLGYFLSIKSLF